MARALLWWCGCGLLLASACSASPAPAPSPAPLVASSSVGAPAIAQLQQVLGVPLADGRHGSAHSSRPQAAPEYMTRLYHAVVDEDGVARAPNPYNARVVRCFLERGSEREDVFLFNVTALPVGERLLQAELRVYRLRHNLRHSVQSNDESHELLVRVYQVEDEASLERPDTQRLLSVQAVGARGHGWLVFNVRAAVQSWLAGEPRLGLLLAATTLDGRPVRLRWARHSQRRQPLLVLFDDDDSAAVRPVGDPTSLSYRRAGGVYDYEETEDVSGAEEETTAEQRLRRRRRRSVEDGTLPAARPANATVGPAECARHPLYVDFERIGWNSWILSPKGYAAYQCRGHCDFPLGQSQRPTNHATVQSLAHQLGLAADVVRPSCVPAALKPLTLLYFDDSHNVVLKSFEGMVAESCGCH
ncbi:bone morphogenetic protein 5-like [Schistocerca gregaria]|uniref:bone morphogenetic protein 5-like n=1 Tax=Schistocerca gregaria TaxID=7010 RepID=UPI00211EF34B|nr:bone morphogenetic protein 5-like [Schistocerca gregaria]